jgi:hypothetical protein
MNAISREQHEELKNRIEPLRQQVEGWRANKGNNEKMPAPLWEQAIALAKIYGVSPVQRILRIDYRGLERRALGIVKPPSKAGSNPSRSLRQSFVELPALSSRRAEHVVELEDSTGRKLTVKVVGGQLGEVLPLAQAFWRPSV